MSASGTLETCARALQPGADREKRENEEATVDLADAMIKGLNMS
jgi:hypothetical protein